MKVPILCALAAWLGMVSPAVAAPKPASPGGADDSARVLSGNMASQETWDLVTRAWKTPMTMTSLSTTTGPGTAVSFQEALTTIVRPALREWGRDCRLVQVTGNRHRLLPLQPSRSAGPKGMPDSWQLVYAATNDHEALVFELSPEQTRRTRITWGPLDLAPGEVAVDEREAIARLVRAIRDRKFRSEEEQTGLDYFLRLPYERYQPDFPSDMKVTVQYDLPGDAHWHVRLQSVLGRLVWEVLCTTGEPTEAATWGVSSDEQPPGQDWDHQAAGGLVDARTGAVIRFTRPFKIMERKRP